MFPGTNYPEQLELTTLIHYIVELGGGNMILSKGNNKFTDNVFSYWEWSAPILQTHDEVISKLAELKLEGRIVKDVRCIGMAYNWRKDDIVECVYNKLERMMPEQRGALQNPEAFLPEGVKLLRWVEIDEPLLIEFEDGDILAIDYSEGSSIRMDMNTIPKNIYYGTNKPTIHANILFENIIGKEIVSVEVITSTVMPEFTGSHGLSLNEQQSYITGVQIRYREGDFYYPQNSLYFTSYMDYGIVELKNHNGEIMKIHAPEVKEVVKGFIEKEVLDSQEEFDLSVF